jgi:hypothetical protein
MLHQVNFPDRHHGMLLLREVQYGTSSWQVDRQTDRQSVSYIHWANKAHRE